MSLDKSHNITNNFHSYNSVKYTRVTIQQAHDTVCVRVCVYLHTVVADWAVRAPWRAIEAAGRAPLHAHLDSFDLHRLIEWSTEIILFILILLR